MQESERAKIRKKLEMDKQEGIEVVPTPRTIEGLREILFDQIDQVRANECSLAKSREIRRIAQSIIESVHAEIKFHRQITDTKVGGKVGFGILKLVDRTDEIIIDE